MANRFRLVIETPNGNLVAGMRWLLSSYTLRLNHRRKITGHVFSGRYKAIVVDGSGNGYFKTVCDYVHLNPARANLLGSEDRLLAFPWSSLQWYLAAREHRPSWIRTERVLGAHGIREDGAAGRTEFEQRMEWRRRSEAEDADREPLKRAGVLVGAVSSGTSQIGVRREESTYDSVAMLHFWEKTDPRVAHLRPGAGTADRSVVV